jgi:L-asparaginase/Glu-tRNA(Gln) amidotransferase subunit D
MQRKLVCTVFGGTMASEKTPNGIVPKPGKIQELVRFEVSDKALAPYGGRDSKQRIIINEYEPIDSSQARGEDIESMITTVRQELRTHKGHDHVVIYGTDTMEDFAQCLSQGVSKEGLANSSFVLTGSMDCAEKSRRRQRERTHQEGSDAVRNLEHAICLASQKEMRSRMAFCFGNVAYRLRGLQKIHANDHWHAFLSRFPKLATLDKEHWDFNAEQSFDPPTGVKKQQYKLSPGLKELELGVYAHYDDLVHEMSRPELTDTCKAVILKTPGSGNIRSNKSDLSALTTAAALARHKGIPFVVIGRAMQGYTKDPVPIYAVSAERHDGPWITGNGLAPSEVREVLSSFLYKVKKTPDLTAEAIVCLAKVAINDYREFTKGEISADEYVVRKKLAFN